MECTSRIPVEGDIVRKSDGQEICLEDEDGNVWTLQPEEVATVSQVDEDGDFRLRNPHGLESIYTLRKYYSYTGNRERSISQNSQDTHSETSQSDEESVFASVTSGFLDESGYDSSTQDPVDYFFVVAKWQRQVTNLQKSLKEGHINDKVREINGTVRERGQKVASNLKEGQAKLANTLRKGPSELGKTLRQRGAKTSNALKKVGDDVKQRTEQQVQVLNDKLEKVMAKARMKKVRQMRHMFCFLCSMANVVVMSFWLGRFPHTIHWWYTANCVWLIGCRAIWYKWHNCHYFLLDLCYWVNGMLLAYLWLDGWCSTFFSPSGCLKPWMVPICVYDSEWMFQALQGCSGVLMLSVPIFRNSFVPHSLDRVTSFQIHIMPMVQLWVLRWPNSIHVKHWPWKIPEDHAISFMPSVVLYLWWAGLYYTFQWGFRRQHIERRGYETLYKHMAVDMGLEKKLPRRIRGPIKSRAVFVTGHFLGFVLGIPVVHFNYWVHTVCVVFCVVWGFRNGANFYMTYFYKVYDEQISSFEKQMAQAEREMKQQMRVSSSNGNLRKEMAHADRDDSDTNGDVLRTEDLDDE